MKKSTAMTIVSDSMSAKLPMITDTERIHEAAKLEANMVVAKTPRPVIKSTNTSRADSQG